jgi:hypothetical protein
MNPFYGAAAAVFLLIASFGGGWYFGRQGLELTAANQVVKQEVAQGKKRTTDQSTVAQEAKTYEAAEVAPLAAPVVRVCLYTPAASVSGAYPAGPRIDAPVDSRSPDPVPVAAGPDIGPPLVQVGHVIDAQVAGLQHYIEHVCQAKAL